MKIFYHLFALGIAQLTIGAGTANPPYDDVYNRLCSNGVTSGTIKVEGKSFNYQCDRGQGVGDSNPTKTPTAEQCAGNCGSRDQCSTAVWDRRDGRCWLGKGKGDLILKPGQIHLVSNGDEELAKRKADLERYKPVPAKCDGAHEQTRQVTESNGRLFLFACATRFGTSKGSHIGTPDTFQECVDLCAKRSCWSVMWNRIDKKCWGSTINALAGEVSNNDNIDAAFGLFPQK